MGLLIILLVGIYLFWILLIRRSYFGMKFKTDKDGIVFQPGITNEELMMLLREKLVYPDLKEIHYDENGQVVLVCKYGQHILTTENGRLYVGREFIPKGTPSFKEMRNMEEAECLKVYLQKVYDPNCNLNPYHQYKKLKNYNKHKIGVTVALLLVCIYGVVSALDESGIKEESESQGISSGYLTDYSSEITVGEALTNFFAEPEWVSYKQGATQYVDFKGVCSFQGDDNAVAIITFVVSGDNFKVEKITINGEDIGIINQETFLQAVYRESTNASDTSATETQDAVANDDGTGNNTNNDEALLAESNGGASSTDTQTSTDSNSSTIDSTQATASTNENSEKIDLSGDWISENGSDGNYKLHITQMYDTDGNGKLSVELIFVDLDGNESNDIFQGECLMSEYFPDDDTLDYWMQAPGYEFWIQYDPSTCNLIVSDYGENPYGSEIAPAGTYVFIGQTN